MEIMEDFDKLNYNIHNLEESLNIDIIEGLSKEQIRTIQKSLSNITNKLENKINNDTMEESKSFIGRCFKMEKTSSIVYYKIIKGSDYTLTGRSNRSVTSYIFMLPRKNSEYDKLDFLDFLQKHNERYPMSYGLDTEYISAFAPPSRPKLNKINIMLQITPEEYDAALSLFNKRLQESLSKL